MVCEKRVVHETAGQLVIIVCILQVCETQVSKESPCPPADYDMVELGCEEIIPEDILESDEEMPQSAPVLQVNLEKQLLPQVEPISFSPDELYQPTPNLLNAALISPGEVLLPSSTVSAPPPDISPELFKVNFPHIILSCHDMTGLYGDTLPPLSPAGGEGVSYLTDSPYIQ